MPKHFPFPWFESLLTTGACTASTIANLDAPATGLVHDLQRESTTPAFSWITPDNCSDAHDAICAGNSLSGAFDANGNPVYAPNGLPAYDPEATKPVNSTGGLYASDLFLKYYVPLIEQSAAFKDGGLIDVTFDEANPPYANSSFNNANNQGSTAGVSVPATAAGYAKSDQAGESFVLPGGRVATTNTEPTGPNTPLLQDANGNQVYPGPGDSAFIDRPSSLTGDPVDSKYVIGGANAIPGARTDSTGVSGGIGGDVVTDPTVTAPDAGRPVAGAGVPANACVGPVSDAGPRFDTVSSNAPAGADPATNPKDKAYVGSFEVVDCTTNGVKPLTGNVTSVSFPAESAATDPLFSSTIETPGGGDTGSVLISPLIKPGTVSDVAYNHYSWLRTMEDLFAVDAHGKSPGLDGLGHLGFAAQPGLRTFGADIFTNVPGHPRHEGDAHGATLPPAKPE
ncbi:MAG TPA: hypothetical protein VFP61_08510 [Acidimicrobiales bacterium]|nr:hypothetical protein [Acidimicrobiales bacterium]